MIHRQVMQLILANLAMSRPFVAPPALPPDRLASLRAAFERTAADPTFLSAAAKAGRDISIYHASEIEYLLAASYALPKEIIERAAGVSGAR